MITMDKKKASIWFHILWLSIVLFLAILLSTSVGSASIGPLKSLKVLLDGIPGIKYLIDGSEIQPVYRTIIWNVRLPRIILAGLTGSGLAVVGAAYQGLFRNPLADPHILGVSSGAAVGATLAMLTGISGSVFGIGIIGACAFVGALLTVLVVYGLSGMAGKFHTINILLTGTAISTMLSSMISLLMIFHQEDIEQVYMWTLGSFSAATWAKVRFLFCIVVACSVLIIVFARELNVMVTGEEVAESLGIDTVKTKKIIIVVSSILVAACVAVSGIIGFVGLIIPHCVRLLTGPNHKRLLPISCLAGSIFMITCDTIARTIASPTEIPVGVLTAVIGAPYFIYLIHRCNKQRV